MSLTLLRYDITPEKILKNTIIKKYYLYSLLCTSFVGINSVKFTNLHYISDKNHTHSELCQKVIILKVLENILYIN